ncbi:GTPase [Pectobacterium carotovorum]|uniref:GTPase n=3 Tax=Pectobacterium carotovorum TaxID=554 RepID=UPI0015DF6BE9|nr:GTPase [Pectobacterium carotovorum]MBA0194609.1 50S ribosome-binding GTPase [Pectobacterium carotovorum]MBA0202891.1 50S ribosome-binding GTPase [Pectobacterium carotovorum]
MGKDAFDTFLGDAYDRETNTFNSKKAEEDAFNNKNKFNIILFGATGVGKSTLVNSFFGEDLAVTGKGKPVTQHLTKIKSTKKGVVLWDTKGIEAKDYELTIKQLKKDIKNSFEEFSHVDDVPHLGWLCIDSSSSRIEPRDFELIKLTEEYGIPTVIVFTKAYGESEDEFVVQAVKEINSNINGNGNLNYVKVLSSDYRINSQITIPSHGMNDLLNISLELLPEGVKGATNALKKAQVVKSEIRLEAMKDSARSVVHAAASAAGVIGASPIPGSDAPLIAAAQSAMIYKINAEFELDSATSNTTSIVTGILGVTAVAQVGKAVVSNLLKFIPGVGSVIGGAISATTAIALTEAVGHAYIKVLETYYNKDNGSVELPSNVTTILSTFKDYFSFKK